PKKSDEQLMPVRVSLYRYRSQYLAAARAIGDTPLDKVKADTASSEWYQIASGKGVLLLHELRWQIGDDKFLKLMDSFGTAHAGKPVSTEEFVAAVEKDAF